MTARILIVEDNPDTAHTTAQICESWGYRTKTASNGSDGLTAVDAFRPHLVLLDLELPKMSGLEVALLVRHSKLHRKVPIICITGYDVPDQAAFAGCDQFLKKPVDIALLEEAIAANLPPKFSAASAATSTLAKRLGRFW